jgi:hypothetical protein
MDDYRKGMSHVELCDHCELTSFLCSNRGTTALESNLL